MPSTCTGSPKDHTPCTCTLFILKRSKQTKCKTCGHRFSHHSDVPTAPQDSNAPPAPKAPGDKYVTRLFKSLEATAVHERQGKRCCKAFDHPVRKQMYALLGPPILYNLTSLLIIILAGSLLSEGKRKGKEEEGHCPHKFSNCVPWHSEARKDSILPMWGPGMLFPLETANCL